MDEELTARQALARSKKSGLSGTGDADRHNYSLTLKRLMKMISAAADKGERQMGYAVPWLVIDGTSTDNRVLARQLEKRLQQLGFSVSRETNKLFISWDLELEEAEKRRAREVEAEERKAMRSLRKQARTGRRSSVRLSRSDGMSTPLDRPPGPEHSRKKGKRSPMAGGFSVTLKK